MLERFHAVFPLHEYFRLEFSPDMTPGDFEQDGDVNLEDFGLFQAEFTGPAEPPLGRLRAHSWRGPALTALITGLAAAGRFW